MKSLLLTQEFLPELPGGIAVCYYHLGRRMGDARREGAVRLFDWSVPAERLRAFLDCQVGGGTT